MPSPSSSLIEAGWRAFARRWHPDKPKGDAEIFFQGKAAREARKAGDEPKSTNGSALLTWEIFKKEHGDG